MTSKLVAYENLRQSGVTCQVSKELHRTLVVNRLVGARKEDGTIRNHSTSRRTRKHEGMVVSSDTSTVFITKRTRLSAAKTSRSVLLGCIMTYKKCYVLSSNGMRGNSSLVLVIFHFSQDTLTSLILWPAFSFYISLILT